MPHPQTRSELLKGKRLGSYEVGTLLGHGGMASVFEGVHVGLAKPVAIKVLHEHVANSEAMRARFVREARLAATLEHPNVVKILDVGIEDGLAFLVMERLKGEDLAAHLRAAPGKKLPLQQALAILLPVAAALSFAHEHGVMHRDLKPANVFLSRDRHGEVLPKIVDFGLSKALEADEGEALTGPETVIGTPEYMAPEQTFGTRRAGPRTDQYALAILVYEAVTGRLPFDVAGGKDLFEAIRSGVLVPIRTLDPSLQPALEAALTRALSRDPEDRFADVRAFARELLPLADVRTAIEWSRDFDMPPPASTAMGSSVTEPEEDTLVGVPPPAPPLPCPPGSSTFHIKGIAYRSIVRLIEQMIPRGLATIDEDMGDPRISAFVRQPFIETSRYDILPMLPLNVAIARALGKSLEGLASEQGIGQAKYDVRYVYRRVFEASTLDDIADFLNRYGVQYYEAGECVSEQMGPDHVVVRRRRLPAYVLPWYAPLHGAYGAEVLRLKGAARVEVRTRPHVEIGTRHGVAIVDLFVDLRWKR
jgi:serine/threonine protein kinase